MSTRPRTRADAQGRGLDDGPETERPWSSVTGTRPTTRDVSSEQSRRERPLKVTVQYVAIDGSDGEALEQCQIAAIRRALAWLASHPGSEGDVATE
ncbi:hypothetical protein GCM10010307_82490 [Streptomyces vastus]|uniref:Uncharacterized protein n=1 Tax=Streptomyces vastus TaxID=285451 RepID=A0ABN3RXB1_9ACTN